MPTFERMDTNCCKPFTPDPGVPPAPLDLAKGAVLSWDDFGVYVDGELVGAIGQTYGHIGEWVIPRKFTQATIIAGATLAGPYLMVRDEQGEISHPLDLD